MDMMNRHIAALNCKSSCDLPWLIREINEHSGRFGFIMFITSHVACHQLASGLVTINKHTGSTVHALVHLTAPEICL